LRSGRGKRKEALAVRFVRLFACVGRERFERAKRFRLLGVTRRAERDGSSDD
jgi:hypothetical protein